MVPNLTDPLPPMAQVQGVAMSEGYRIRVRVRILRTMHLTCTPTNPKNPLACCVIGRLP